MLTFINGIIRHAMTFGGGFLVEDGLTSGEEVQTVIAATITLVGFGWSLYEKLKAKNA